MPAKSKQQLKYIYAMRNKYKTIDKAPKDMKWVFDDEWTHVKMSDLPDYVDRNYVMNFEEFIFML
ncbi:MAG: hypothetical protein M0R46_13675 [Candidatus Muirbacterium halophilum]|nr:hypothetical protein [Candidatus Muirbacterium halophilum]